LNAELDEAIHSFDALRKRVAHQSVEGSLFFDQITLESSFNETVNVRDSGD